MRYIIFDVDGTLTESNELDTSCYKNAILKYADVTFKNDWGDYKHVTDSGILKEIIDSHNLQKHETELTHRIKQSFIDNIRSHIQKIPVAEVSGAGHFIDLLKFRSDIRIGIATGGWQETAKLKLNSTGIDIDGIEISSSNDAISRINIMQHSLRRMGGEPSSRVTYFGDASWDKKACKKLDWNFILVGNSIEHHQQINNFNQTVEVLASCGEHF